MDILLLYIFLVLDSINDTSLTLLSDEFLNSFYLVQDQKPSTGTPTSSSDDNDENSNEFTISIIVGSVAFVLGLILILLIILWFGSKFFSQNK